MSFRFWQSSAVLSLCFLTLALSSGCSDGGGDDGGTQVNPDTGTDGSVSGDTPSDDAAIDDSALGDVGAVDTETDTGASTDTETDTGPSTDTATGPLPGVSGVATDCIEGDAGTTVCTLPIVLDAPAPEPMVLAVWIESINGEDVATADDDYFFSREGLLPGLTLPYYVGIVRIPTGATRAELAMQVIGDTEVERDETVRFSVETVRAGALPSEIAITEFSATIINDDEAPPITAAMENRLCVEGDAGESVCEIPIRLSAPATVPVRFRAGVDALLSTSEAGVEFRLDRLSYEIPAGASEGIVELVIVGDVVPEPDEVVVLTLELLEGAVPAEINGRGAVISILNDDVLSPVISLPSNLFQHTATTLADGRVFVAGGNNGAGEVATTLFVSADGRSVVAGPLLPEERARHAATLLPDGRVLLSGGLTAGSNVSLSSTVVCDLTVPRCDAGPVMASGRLLHAAVLLADGKVLMAGGVPDYGLSVKLASAERYVGEVPGTPAHFEPAENDMPLARDSMSSIRMLSGEVLLAGGAGVGTGTQLLRYRPGVGFLLDPATLSAARINGTASLLPDGRVLLVGGGDSETTEWVSASSDPSAPLVVTPGPVLTETRYSHTAISLPDGRVVVSGGLFWDPATSILGARSSVAVLGPDLTTWQTSTPLSTPRGQFDAAYLPAAGLIAHIGGSNGVSVSGTMDLLAP